MCLSLIILYEQKKGGKCFFFLCIFNTKSVPWVSESLAVPKLMFAGIQKYKNHYMEAWTYVKQSNKIYDFERTRTHKHLVCKKNSPSLTKWLTVRLRCTWLFVRVPLKSVSLQISRLFWARISLTVKKSQNVDSF